MGKKSAPKADPAIALAAQKSAELGAAQLEWAKEQAKITNGWAEEDRARYKNTFIPLQDKYIEDAKNWASPERQAAEAAQAKADVQANLALANAARSRQMAAVGVDPNSGRYAGIERGVDAAGALASAGAENAARDRVRMEAKDMQGNAINMGSGLAVNPLSSISTSNGATANGFAGAINGVGQQAQILNQDYQNRMQSWQAQQANSAGIWQGVGGLVGLAFGSDEDIKEDKKPARGLLKAVEGMRVENWKYKDGKGDGGEHVGTYAQDFQKQTGKGDGKTINVIDAIGTTMGAVKELSAKVDKLAADRPKRRARGLMMEGAMA